ncbi:MAG: hypothetical protein HOM34_06360 [Planctomycetes bacterium]|jgi:hypothetical protein|nr:hypothetical protein [Planctomycetota bacterium]MBT4028608.1 hypothetical protein [Planctomycetota bacterium]MBT4559500.1 hypothetical protein [Planctomycetota bacterium]MBT5102092.1 hypothetical protein [Planctomycetota bacterium]MBT5120328.1 hypothetical protein [Planctomycetota bacterium]
MKSLRVLALLTVASLFLSLGSCANPDIMTDLDQKGQIISRDANSAVEDFRKHFLNDDISDPYRSADWSDFEDASHVSSMAAQLFFNHKTNDPTLR